MAQFPGCKFECLGDPVDYDDPSSMFPTMLTEQDLIDECQELGEQFAEKAPARLAETNGCPMEALDLISKGVTLNPIRAIANARIRHSLGIETVAAYKIIY